MTCAILAIKNIWTINVTIKTYVSQLDTKSKCVMYNSLKITSVFCCISVINAVSVRIDGLIDLGPNWSYEYKIISPNDNTKHSIAKRGRLQLPDLNDAERLRKDEEQLHRDQERLRREQELLRKETEQLRKDLFGKRHKHQDRKKKVSHSESEEKLSKKRRRETTPSPVVSHKQKRVNKPNPLRVKPLKIPETLREQTPEPQKLPESRKLPESTPSDSEDEEESSSSMDSSDRKTTQKKRTMFDMNDFTTQKNSASPASIEKLNEQLETGPVNEDAASFADYTDVKTEQNKPIKRVQLANATVSTITVVTNATKPTTIKPTTTKPTTTRVTTIRTGNIFSDPHKVKDDVKVNDFTNHIYKQTLKVFDAIKQKTNQYHLKRQLDVLARSYEDKFREFLRDTKHHKIKTRLGTQKVILNTIDMSNRILKRLISFMIGDMDRKGVLRNNVATTNIFQKEVEKEMSLELRHACKKFGICRAGTGFPEFLTDILTIMLQSDNKKFKQSIDALTEVVKSTDYNNVLHSHTEKNLKSAMNKVELLGIERLRPIVMIVKNIITYKNRPIVVNSLAAGGRVNSTLAFLEIIDLLDQKLPRDEANNLEWNDIRSSMKDYSEGKRFDVQEIMETFMKHMKKTVMNMDQESKNLISKNMNLVLG